MKGKERDYNKTERHGEQSATDLYHCNMYC